MLLEEAKRLSKLLPKYLIVTGGVRRGKEEVKDLDFLSVKPLSKVLRDLIDDYNIISVNAAGEHYLSVILRLDGKDIKVDIWRVWHREDLPFAQLGRTGNKQFVVRCRAVAKHRGYKLTDDGLYEDGKKIRKKFPSERSILEFLDITYKSPTERNE